MKKILLLGGTAIQIPIIRKAHEMGLYVITCDNKPDNPGHALADEYHNVSITDNEAVLRLASELKVDAVLNYSLEAGVQAAAYTNEQLGKPTSPYESVRTLSNKRLFREYLMAHGFCTPHFFTCSSKQEAHEKINTLAMPVVVKPTDLWGSRGVSRVDSIDELDAALDHAFSHSRGASIIVEEFIEPCGAPIEGNAFVVNGRLTTRAWSDAYSDPEAANPITPVCFCYPSAQPRELLQKLDDELQRLITLLGMHTSAYNVEARIDKAGNIYLMEVAPRNGGNISHDILTFLTGQDVQRAIIDAALGNDCSYMRNLPCRDCWMGYVVHTNTAGVYQGMWTDDHFRQTSLRRYAPFVSEGSRIGTYSGTNCTIGALIARFDTRQQMEEAAHHPTRFFKPIIG